MEAQTLVQSAVLGVPLLAWSRTESRRRYMLAMASAAGDVAQQVPGTLRRTAWSQLAAILRVAGGLYGVAYGWGGDGAEGERTLDCSGSVSLALRELEALGAVRLTHPGRRWTTATLAAACPKVSGPPRLGDAQLYTVEGRAVHVMLHTGVGGLVLGARGGDSGTHGQDPAAYVDVLPADYWPGHLGPVVRPTL